MSVVLIVIAVFIGYFLAAALFLGALTYLLGRDPLQRVFGDELRDIRELPTSDTREWVA